MRDVTAIIGPPGTGKTTEIMRRISAHDDSAAVYSFTRAAAAEIVSRLHDPTRAQASTIHAAAFRALGLTKDQLAESHAGEFSASGRYQISSASDDADNPYEGRPRTYGDQMLERYQLERVRMTPRAQWDAEVEAFAGAWEAWKKDHDLLDFSDMLERALADVPHAPGAPEHLYLDEAQDCSALQLALLRRWAAHKSCRSITLVGDPWQGIYDHFGANPDMFSDPRLTHKTTVLAQSYRLPRSVHRLALALMRRHYAGYHELRFAPREDEGEVISSPASLRHPEALLPLLEAEIAAGRTVIIQATYSRTSAREWRKHGGNVLRPMIQLLREAAIPYANRWKRRRGDWNPLAAPTHGVAKTVRALCLLACRPERPCWTWNELRRWTAPMRSRSPLGDEVVLRHGAKTDIEAEARVRPSEFLQADDWDRLFDLEVVKELFRLLAVDRDEAEALRWWAARISPAQDKAGNYAFLARIAARWGTQELRREPLVAIGHTYSFKGAEADTVILFPDLAYPAWARWRGDDHDRASVCRVGYVALTRAKSKLVLCAPSSAMYLPLLEEWEAAKPMQASFDVPTTSDDPEGFHDRF